MYTFHLSDVDKINDIKDNVNGTFDDIKKNKRTADKHSPETININRNIALPQNIKKDGSIKPVVIHFHKYVEQEK